VRRTIYSPGGKSLRVTGNPGANARIYSNLAQARINETLDIYFILYIIKYNVLVQLWNIFFFFKLPSFLMIILFCGNLKIDINHPGKLISSFIYSLRFLYMKDNIWSDKFLCEYIIIACLGQLNTLIKQIQ